MLNADKYKNIKKFSFKAHISLDRKRNSIAHSLSLSTSHRPDMTEILLKRT